MTSTRRRKPTSGKDTTKKMGNQKQTLKNKILTVLGVAFFIIALGIVGNNDYEYETRPSICREYQGSTVCYKP